MTPSAEPGLCGRCRNARVITSARGSRFVLCELSRTNLAFPRYPLLPVLTCAGFAAAPSEAPLDGPGDPRRRPPDAA